MARPSYTINIILWPFRRSRGLVARIILLKRGFTRAETLPFKEILPNPGSNRGNRFPTYGTKINPQQEAAPWCGDEKERTINSLLVLQRFAAWSFLCLLWPGIFTAPKLELSNFPLVKEEIFAPVYGESRVSFLLATSKNLVDPEHLVVQRPRIAAPTGDSLSSWVFVLSQDFTWYIHRTKARTGGPRETGTPEPGCIQAVSVVLLEGLQIILIRKNERGNISFRLLLTSLVLFLLITMRMVLDKKAVVEAFTNDSITPHATDIYLGSFGNGAMFIACILSGTRRGYLCFRAKYLLSSLLPASNKNTQNDKVKGRSSEAKSNQMTAPASKKALLTGSSRGGGCTVACTFIVIVVAMSWYGRRLPSAPETEAEAPKDVPTQRVGDAATWCRLVLTQVRELVPMSRGMILGSVGATEGVIDAGIVAAHPHSPLLSASRKAPVVLSCVRLVHLRVVPGCAVIPLALLYCVHCALVSRGGGDVGCTGGAEPSEDEAQHTWYREHKVASTPTGMKISVYRHMKSTQARKGSVREKIE
ncbi:hypothetical protein DFH08DRAFT_812856 [Mycena albidolilacea]|uniref:Uncharacterized protein n=1 Tax=Mycena albidolilacea TaxID=1033008 RepID=A0AAD6ZSY2_9AGAR|nr:hypothetical protein DFH08DRAFT_812856 [Mycena albidolilacea]